MNRTSAVTLFCRNNCITFVRFRLIGEFMDFSSQILHFVFLHYAIQAEKLRTPPKLRSQTGEIEHGFR